MASKLETLMDLVQEYAVEYSEDMRHRNQYEATSTAYAALQDALKAVVEDAERLDWLDGAIFMSRWNGVIGADSVVDWTIAGDWRHTVARMRGHDLRAAIDAARKP